MDVEPPVTRVSRVRAVREVGGGFSRREREGKEKRNNSALFFFFFPFTASIEKKKKLKKKNTSGPLHRHRHDPDVRVGPGRRQGGARGPRAPLRRGGHRGPSPGRHAHQGHGPPRRGRGAPHAFGPPVAHVPHRRAADGSAGPHGVGLAAHGEGLGGEVKGEEGLSFFFRCCCRRRRRRG